ITLAVVAGALWLHPQAGHAQLAGEPIPQFAPAPALSEMPELLAPVQTPLPAAVPDAEADAEAAPTSADDIAAILSKIGDQLYEACLFDLSDVQSEVQAALLQAYVQKGASGPIARHLAATQIQLPKLSAECERVRRAPQPPAAAWNTPTVPSPVPVNP